MSKFPNPFGKPKKVPTPNPKESKQDGQARANAGMALQGFLAKAPPSAKKAPTPTPTGGYKPGMSGEQYGGGNEPDKYAAMKPKVSTKDKVLNKINSAVGLPGKPMKMVPKSPPKK